MINEYYLNSIKAKYNYDDKTIRALGKILPALVTYFGEEYEDPSVFIDDVKQFNELHGDNIKAGAYLFIPVYR